MTNQHMPGASPSGNNADGFGGCLNIACLLAPGFYFILVVFLDPLVSGFVTREAARVILVALQHAGLFISGIAAWDVLKDSSSSKAKEAARHFLTGIALVYGCFMLLLLSVLVRHMLVSH